MRCLYAPEVPMLQLWYAGSIKLLGIQFDICVVFLCVRIVSVCMCVSKISFIVIISFKCGAYALVGHCFFKGRIRLSMIIC